MCSNRANPSELHVLIYSHAFAPSIGGIETVVMSLATGLAAEKQSDGSAHVNVTVVTHTLRGSFDDESLPFQVVRQPSLRKLVRIILGTDVIHLAGPAFLPMLFGRLFRKPVLVEHDGYQAVCPNGVLIDERTRTVCPGHFMARRYMDCLHCNTRKVGLSRSSRMLLLTFPRRRICARVARNIYPSLHIGKRVMLPNGVTIFHGTPDPDAPDLKDPKGNSSIACFTFVGRLVEEKGVTILLLASEILSRQGYDFRLKVIGDGPDRSILEELTDRYGLRSRTTFTGGLRGNALREALRDSTASIMPSTWEDVAPLAAIEHLIHGRIVVSSDIGGLGEIVGDAGLKFAPGDAEGLACCLRRVLDDPALVDLLAEKARRRAQQLFREDRMVAEHLALYREVAADYGLSTGRVAADDEHV